MKEPTTSVAAPLSACALPSEGLTLRALASVASMNHVQRSQPTSPLPGWAVDSCFQGLDKRRRKRKGSLSPPNSPPVPSSPGSASAPSSNPGSPKQTDLSTKKLKLTTPPQADPLQAFPFEHRSFVQLQEFKIMPTEPQKPRQDELERSARLTAELQRLQGDLARVLGALDAQTKQHNDELERLRRELEVKEYMITGMKQHVELLQKELSKKANAHANHKRKREQEAEPLPPAPKRLRAVAAV